MDNYYAIEVKLASKNAWFTPQESNNYYGAKYSREGVTVHWWGDGTGADNHDNIVNYFLGQGSAGNKSVNYVVSDRKITLMVSPDNVAWCSQGGNPTTISIEHQPTLSAEGYKRSGWLVWQLEGRYGHRMSLYPHSKWFSTSCPGSIDINRIRAEADKFASGAYNPAPPPPAPKPLPPTPVPPAPTISITYSKLPSPVMYKINKNTSLWNFNSGTWAGFKPVKAYPAGELISVYGIADNHSVHAQYGMTAYSFGTADTTGSPKATNGFNMKDLDLVTTPAQPVPEPPVIVPPIIPPTPVPPVSLYPDWFINFWTKLIDAIKNILK